MRRRRGISGGGEVDEDGERARKEGEGPVYVVIFSMLNSFFSLCCLFYILLCLNYLRNSFSEYENRKYSLRMKLFRNLRFTYCTLLHISVTLLQHTSEL